MTENAIHISFMTAIIITIIFLAWSIGDIDTSDRQGRDLATWCKCAKVCVDKIDCDNCDRLYGNWAIEQCGWGR